MNHYRQVQRSRDAQLSAENFALALSWRVVIVVVESNLAPGNYFVGLFDEISQASFCRIIEQLCIVRMHTDRRVNSFVLFSQCDRAFECAAVWIARAHVEHRRDAGIESPRDYFFAISIIFRTVDVAMRIDEGHWRVQSSTFRLGFRNVKLNLNAERDRLVFGKLAAPKSFKS